MKKYALLLLPMILAIVLAQNVAAYTVTATQTQEVSSSTEFKGNTKSKVESSSEVSQEQIQESRENEHYRVNKKLERMENRGVQKGERRDEHSASVSAKRSERCEAVTARVSKHIASFTENYQTREDNYKRIYQTVTELVARLKAKGIDVTTLENAVKNLQAERAQLIVALDAYISKAEQLKQLPCDANSATKKAAFAELRTARQTYLNKLQDVGSVITTQLKPALQTVKASAENSK